MSYDVAYQEWVKAVKDGDYPEADNIRTRFEQDNGLTIFSIGDKPVENVTVRRMKASAWEKKFGNPKVGKILETQDSYIRGIDHTYRGLLK